MGHRGIVAAFIICVVGAGCPAPPPVVDDAGPEPAPDAGPEPERDAGPEPGPDCVSSSDCAAPGPCEEARCIDGRCLVVPDTSDRDSDGAHCGTVVVDCDDDDPFVSPTVRERCDNGVDDDCDGSVDGDDVGDCSVACVDGWCFEGDITHGTPFFGAAAVVDDLWQFGEGMGFARHRRGHWTAHAVTDLEPGVQQPGARALWGSGDDDVWAVGRDALHFDGVTWTTVLSDVEWSAVAGAGVDDVWAAGEALWHFDGASWTSIPVPLSGPVGSLHIDALGRVVVASADTVLRGGIDGFEPIHTLAAPVAQPGLDDVDGRLFIATATTVEDEAGTVLARFEDDMRGRRTLLMLGDDDFLVGVSGMARRLGDGVVDFLMGDARKMTRGADGVPVFVDFTGGIVWRYEDDRLAPTRMPLGMEVVDATVVDDDDAADGVAAWALFALDQRPQLQRRVGPGVWRDIEIDIDPGAVQAVVGIDADHVWVFDGRARLLERDVVVATIDVLETDGARGCVFDGAAWIMAGDGAGVHRLDVDGGVLALPVPDDAVLCCFATTMFIHTDAALLQPRGEVLLTLPAVMPSPLLAARAGDTTLILDESNDGWRLVGDELTSLGAFQREELRAALVEAWTIDHDEGHPLHLPGLRPQEATLPFDFRFVVAAGSSRATLFFDTNGGVTVREHVLTTP